MLQHSQINTGLDEVTANARPNARTTQTNISYKRKMCVNGGETGFKAKQIIFLKGHTILKKKEMKSKSLTSLSTTYI